MSGLIAMGVTSATQAISLSNFTPRIENLPSPCQSAYTTQIQGCQAGDFTNGARCSANCVQGLVTISELVSQQCSNVDVPETSIIGVFLLGQGIPALCPGVEVTTIAPSSTQVQPPPQTSTEAQASNEPAAPPPSSSQAIESDSSVAESSATSVANTPNESVAPPTSTAQPQLTFATGSPPPAASQTASSQRSNQDSGGGSPFDVVATGSSPPLNVGHCALSAIVGVALLFATVF
ncbi:hypothetical protein BU26DRAFT_562731 [Trematosphaeria pertusa]|uniref:Uncharacterized protein n=1 Tax=Trematosphaeria pertusa TaxID=390896 RepID=A0A6A6IK19_9PLEO|nr:uncharacterized protein BU26DRAFT_562731 [Trematosphaeria pertusa]KAF2250771.1 hypothetical protein BU26DRAFT_562731 [Trematosphaeria pertusa]